MEEEKSIRKKIKLYLFFSLFIKDHDELCRSAEEEVH